MYTAYGIYEAERPKSAAEQREEARRTGELALAPARLPHRRRSAAGPASAGPAAPARWPSPESCGSCG